MAIGDGGRRKPRLVKGGVHHANIRDKAKAVKRLRSAFRKIQVKLTIEKNSSPVEVLAVLTEITPRSAYLFSATRLRKKTTVAFHIAQPLSMTVRAVVRYCERTQQESVVQTEGGKPSYRVYVEFVLANESERLAMVDLYEKIRNEDYVATQWHIYATEKMQHEQRLRVQAERLEKAIAASQTAQAKAEEKASEPAAEAEKPAAPANPKKKAA